MKRLIFAILVVLSAVDANAFTDTTLSSPLQVVAPATVLRQYSFLWGPESFTVQYNLLDAGGNIVEQRTCVLEGTDFTTGDESVVTAGKVGQTYKSVIAAYLQTKCKGKWNLTGTE